MKKRALKLGVFLTVVWAMPSFANDFLMASCEGALKTVREQVRLIYQTNARKNATPVDKIGSASSGAVAFGLGSDSAESSSAKDILARLNGLEAYLNKQAAHPDAGQDLRILVAVGPSSIEEALKKLDDSAAADRYEDWSDEVDDSSPVRANTVMGVPIPARLSRLRIPRKFLGEMFAIWVFPGPIGYNLMGVPTLLKNFLNQASIENFMGSHLSLSSLNLYHQWVVPNATQLSITAGILLASLYRSFGFQKPKFVTAIQNGLRRLNPFAGELSGNDDSTDDEAEEKELRPLASQFESFMASYRQALKNPTQNTPSSPHYFATSYFDRETFEREVAASNGDMSLDEMDESETNRKIDMMFFYRDDKTPVLMVVDRKN